MFAKRDLTQGSIPRGLLGFALPLILGNLLQQLYNLADTWVVGRFIGEGALAAVGSSYTLMTFLTSILLGLCMGSSVYFSIQYGRQDPDRLRNGIFQSFLLIGGLTLLLNLTVYLTLDGILVLLQIPPDILGLTKEYLQWIFAGMVATFLYNFCQSSPLRGDSATRWSFGDFRGSEHRPGHPLCGARAWGFGGRHNHGDRPVVAGWPVSTWFAFPLCGSKNATGIGTGPP
ncbi:MAG: MATE family efflux transporter [Evtepia gabavorous]